MTDDQVTPVDQDPVDADEAPADPRRWPLEALPPELYDGLTVWGDWGGAQIRIESSLLVDDHGALILDDKGAPQLAPVPPIGCLYLAHRDDAPRSTENGHPYRLNLTEARALRDLLNIATARGAL